MRVIALSFIVAAAATAGCRPWGKSGLDPAPAQGKIVAESPSATAPQESGGAVMAYVNGRPIYMEQLHDLLIRDKGMEKARYLVDVELVNQAAAKQDLSADDEETAAEHAETLKEWFPSVSQAGQRERLLEPLLMRGGISRRQWRMTMRLNVLLSKLALPHVQISDTELQAEFKEQYGRRVVVRHIQLSSVSQVQEIIEKLRAGADFADLARNVSENPYTAVQGGLVPPIGPRSEGFAPAFRKAARAMKKVGEISDPIQVQTVFHILYLEKIIEPQDVQYEDVKDSLAHAVRARKLRRLRRRILADLNRNATIEYANAFLKSRRGDTDKGN